MSSNLRRTSSYLSQHSTIDEYMPKSSDSDDELLSEQRTPLQQFVVNGQLSNFPSMDALNTMSLQDPTPMCSEFYEGHPATRTSPFLLTPIDTSAGIDILQNVYEQSAKNKAARNAHGETPTKKMRTTPQHAQQPFSPRDVLESGDSQRDIEVQFRQACYATQPPFNSGIPSIFAPHSLTRETNPFFLQSSLPSAAVLPSIQTLLQSERANPFLTSIPPSLKSELDSVHIPNESALAQQGGFLSHLAVPDAAVGYGFVFGGNSYVSPPPLPTISGKPAASTGTSNNGSSSSSGRVTRQSKAEKGSVAQLPAPQLSVDVSAASPVTPYGRAALANQGFVSTPNIDRACEYLSKQTRTSRCVQIFFMKELINSPT